MIKEFLMPLIIAFLFAANLGCFISRQDHHGGSHPIRHGKSTVYYKNNVKKLEGNYKNGKKDGVFTSWRIDGSLKSKTTYSNNKKHGIVMIFDEKNNLMEEAIFKSEQLDGTQKFYNTEGVITKLVEWKNGKEVETKK